MPGILLVLAVFVVLLWAGERPSKSNAGRGARFARGAGGAAAALFAGYVLLRGEIAFALLGGLVALRLFGWLPPLALAGRSLWGDYFHRRAPGGREHAQSDAAAGWNARPPRSGKMTEQEAYQVLGIEPGATAEEVGRAYRSLMKKLHPDQGGPTYLAARVNEAKDVLLRRHR